MLPTLRIQLQDIIKGFLSEYQESASCDFPVTLEFPKDKQHGEFSCPVALKLAKTVKKNPYNLALQIKDDLEKKVKQGSLRSKIKTIEVKRPGFINFFLTHEALYDELREIFQKQTDYGKNTYGQRKKVQVEFVSANPTGPLSVAHARQAAVGDALGNILRFCGYEVIKEYYVNDEGNQINLLGVSVRIRAEELLSQHPLKDVTVDYQGAYVKDIARAYVAKHNIKDARELSKEGKQKEISQFAVDYLMSVIRKDLEDFHVRFDVWTYQSQVADEQKIEEVLRLLAQKGFIERGDVIPGDHPEAKALWFRSDQFGDDKPRVVKKSDGSYTYLAPDIVYHKSKFDRGFSKVINIWGPDHHGYIPRIKAAVQALGKPADAIDVLIVQLATLYKGGKALSMSTRRGQFISLREVIDEVGTDAARYFFLMRHIEQHLDFDLELAKKQTSENPVYYIQYAHARIHSVLAFARDSGLEPVHEGFRLLRESEEIDLIKAVGYFPDVLQVCISHLDPFALASYLLELATVFHKFYDCHRVVGEDRDVSRERLALIDAARIVLANGLNLLGINAPERM